MPKTFTTSGTSPSSNWLALQKKLKSSPSKAFAKEVLSRKKRKLSYGDTVSEVDVPGVPMVASINAYPRGNIPSTPSTSTLPDEVRNGESLASLRKMVSGEIEYTENQKLPGKYLALDCEMVGVGIDGKESSLARVSMVNYYGAVQLDEFVRQREHVVDYRTEFSGIRPKDMITAKSFGEVQKQVADLLQDRILVGHAVHNDLKALLLSHPYTMTRDTQVLAAKHKVMKTKRPALRHLVQQEIGVTIQSGEHSSVTDARATMAVYRIHRKTWDQGFPRLSSVSAPHKRPITDVDVEGDSKVEDDSNDAVRSVRKSRRAAVPGGGRKGVSSGLSVVVKRKEAKTKSGWWKQLNDGERSSRS